MTPASSDRTTIVSPIAPSAPLELRLRLDPRLSRVGVVDGGCGHARGIRTPSFPH
jgi:hypothetical protein